MKILLFLLSLNCIMDPYKVADRKDKYFKIQIGSKQDNISVDRLKPIFSKKNVSSALPPQSGRPSRRTLPPAANLLPPVRITNKSVCFSLPSCWNLPRPALLPRRFVSALLPTSLLGGEKCSRPDSTTTSTLFLSTTKPKMLE